MGETATYAEKIFKMALLRCYLNPYFLSTYVMDKTRQNCIFKLKT